MDRPILELNIPLRGLRPVKTSVSSQRRAIALITQNVAKASVAVTFDVIAML
jgi:hypothetical protein